MEKLKEIGYLLIDGVSAILRMFVAIILPFIVGESFLRSFEGMEMRDFSLAQQLIVVIVLLWVIDVLVRPIVSKLLLGSLRDLSKLFVMQPPKKQEGIADGFTATATAKDA